MKKGIKRLIVAIFLISPFVFAGFAALAKNSQEEAFPETAEFVLGGIDIVGQTDDSVEANAQNQEYRYITGFPDVYITDNPTSNEAATLTGISRSEHYTLMRADFRY